MKRKCQELKRKVLEICLKAGTGHVSSSFSCIEIMVALYYGMLKFDPKNPSWDGRDRFILSKAQASPLLYTILADLGFFSKGWLDTFAKERFGVHLQNDVPGVEISAGSLGMGLGIACGVALARRDRNVYCLMGDAECYEGSVWESALVASHNRLNNLTLLIDENAMGATDWTERMCSLGSLKSKFDAFGWDSEVINGHNLSHILMALSVQSKKPRVIIARTVKGNGCPLMEGDPLYHSRVPECDKCTYECGVK